MTVHTGKNNTRRWVTLVVVALAVVGTVALRNRPRAENPPTRTEIRVAEALPGLLDLGADKCIPCKAMVPILAELEAGLAGRLNVEFIDVWQNPAEARDYHIKLIPTQIFFDAQGQELFRHEGFFARDDILAEWRKLGYKFELPVKVEG